MELKDDKKALSLSEDVSEIYKLIMLSIYEFPHI